MYYIYEVYNKTLNKSYIGMTSDPKNRKRTHLKHNSSSTNKGIIEDRNKGHEFEFIIHISDILTETEAYSTEEDFTKKIEKLRPLYNNSYGKKHTIKTLKRISEAKKRKNLSSETRKKMSDAKLGSKNFMYGKSLTPKDFKKLIPRNLKIKDLYTGSNLWTVKNLSIRYNLKENTIRKIIQKYKD